MKFNKLASIFTALLFSAFITGCGGGSSDDSGKPTKVMYDQINIDMPYSQVVTIVGSDGRNNGFGGNTFNASWVKGDSRITVCLSNSSQVIGKAYTGPETGGKTVAQFAPGLNAC